MSIHDYQLKGLSGGEINLGEFKGKKILLVNTASACGYTPQYAQLQELNDQASDKLQIIGVPSNDFGAQEPGSAEEIQEFCQINYGVSFPLSEKLKVIGDDRHPLFEELGNESDLGDIDWNFNKFLFDEDGKLIEHYRSSVGPLDDSILKNVGLL